MANTIFVTPPVNALITAKPNLRVSGFKSMYMIDFTHRVYTGSIGTFISGKYGIAPNKEYVICVKLTNPVPSAENGGLGIITEAWVYEDLITWPGRGASTTHPTVPIIPPATYVPPSTVKPPGTVTDPPKTDAPVIDPNVPNIDISGKDSTSSDLTNYYLAFALFGVVFLKFIYPKIGK